VVDRTRDESNTSQPQDLNSRSNSGAFEGNRNRNTDNAAACTFASFICIAQTCPQTPYTTTNAKIMQLLLMTTPVERQLEARLQLPTSQQCAAAVHVMLHGITTIILSWPFIHGSQQHTNKQPGTSWTDTLQELRQRQQACRLLLAVHTEGGSSLRTHHPHSTRGGSPQRLMQDQPLELCHESTRSSASSRQVTLGITPVNCSSLPRCGTGPGWRDHQSAPGAQQQQRRQQLMLAQPGLLLLLLPGWARGPSSYCQHYPRQLSALPEEEESTKQQQHVQSSSVRPPCTPLFACPTLTVPGD